MWHNIPEDVTAVSISSLASVPVIKSDRVKQEIEA